ncbi:hypothetical protein BJF79_21695 [Actinomadura sp. CNU-125]|uniref:hypothetical protein n=1 Tax=Actinomadura sp. CNU-125 TaxID=1904961 RepID=UPI000963916B|nr:hypothetical protein [Actinomadura sp. CNU-125]OLT12715.1 hypothetical protein BJF79_21695 [Actinomadura sp. CNU-125]
MPHDTKPHLSLNETPIKTDEAEFLEQLRADFPGHRIWRGRDGGGRLWCWVATLHDPAAGVEPTVIRSDAAALRQALTEEAQRAQQATRTSGGWS